MRRFYILNKDNANEFAVNLFSPVIAKDFQSLQPELHLHLGSPKEKDNTLIFVLLVSGDLSNNPLPARSETQNLKTPSIWSPIKT